MQSASASRPLMTRMSRTASSENSFNLGYAVGGEGEKHSTFFRSCAASLASDAFEGSANRTTWRYVECFLWLEGTGPASSASLEKRYWLGNFRTYRSVADSAVPASAAFVLSTIAHNAASKTPSLEADTFHLGLVKKQDKLLCRVEPMFEA